MTDLLDLTLATTLALTDVTYVVVDPAVTPLDRQATLQTVSNIVNQGRIAYLCNNVQTLDNSSAETTILNNTADVGSLAFAANYFSANKTVRVSAYGILNSIGSPGNLTIKGKFGSTVLATSGAVALQASQVNAGWRLDLVICCLTAGVSGTFTIQGELVYGAGFRLPMPAVAAVTIDTTAAQTFNLTGQFSVADPSNSISNYFTMIERMY